VLESLRNGEAQGLVVVKLDRLTRRLRDLLALVDDYFDLDRGGGHLISLGESFDTRSPAGRAMLQLVGVFSEWERAMARTRTMEVMEGKRERGEHLGGEPPYGYRVEDGKLVPDETERQAMNGARQLRARLGSSLQAIADALNEDGTPRRNGRPWTRQAISRLLE
jgi:site-specific DNA recombinase